MLENKDTECNNPHVSSAVHGGLFYESQYVIRGAVKNAAERFQRGGRDVFIML